MRVRAGPCCRSRSANRLAFGVTSPWSPKGGGSYMAAASSWKKVAGIRALGRLPCMKQRAMFAWAALLAAHGGCGGGGGAISPGVADKDAAVATVRQVSFLDGALSKGDPVEILDNVGGLIGGSSLIVIGRPSSAALGALSAPAPGTPQPADADRKSVV